MIYSDPSSGMQVFRRDDDGEFKWHLLSGASTKWVLDSAAMQPPQSRLRVCIEPLNSWHDSRTQDLRPAELVIEYGDGRAVFVRQFIEAVHEYALPLGRPLLRYTDVRSSVDHDHARFFDGVSAGSEGNVRGQPGFAANVVEDPTGGGEKCAWIWEGMDTRVRNHPAWH